MNSINDISNRTIVRILAIATAFTAVIYFGLTLHRVLTWIGVAFFLAVAINPAVEFFAKWMPRKSRGLAAGIVFVLILGLFGTIFVTLVPPMVSQTQSLAKKVPDFSASLQNSNLPIADLARKYNLVDQIRVNEARISSGVANLGGSAFEVARGLLDSLVAILTTLVITFFMVVEGPAWIKLFASMQPEGRLKHREELAVQMYHAVTGWVTGNLLTSLIAAVVVALTLFVIGIPYSIPLGLLVGLFDLLPLIGATLGAVVVLIVCLFSSVSAALIMLVFFLIYQQVENHVLQP